MIRRYAFACVFFAAACTQGADTFRIGEVDLVIPAPEQSVRVTAQMPLLQKLIHQAEDPVNNTLAAYVSPVVAEAGLAGQLPELGNYFLLKVAKQLVEPVVSLAEFDELRRLLLSQQEQAVADLRKRLPQMVDRIEQNLEDEFGAGISLGVGEVLPLGVYNASKADMVGFSLLMEVGAQGADAAGRKVVTSCLLVNVSGKVLFLYAYGDADDLIGTRERSTAWANAIVSANAPAPLKAEGRGINLRNVLIAGIAGGVIGGVGGLIGFFRNKRRLRAQ